MKILNLQTQKIEIDNIKVWTQRLSYVGELGYELYVKNFDSKNIYKKIIEKGKIQFINCECMH